MHDPRLNKLARLIVDYSLDVKPGLEVCLQASDLAKPLVRECYREALRAGAHPTVRVAIDGIQEIFLKEAAEEQLSYISPLVWTRIEKTDRFLNILGGHNTKSLTNIDNAKLQKTQRAQAELVKRYSEREAAGELKWSLCQFPTHSGAQEASMSLDEYWEFVMEACKLNEDDPVKAWREFRDKQQLICDYLVEHSEFHVVAEGTDLTYSAAGRVWVNCDGTRNMPDGEVFTGPIEDSVNGHISYSYPAIHLGHEIENVRLEFKDGKVVDATADKGEAFLHSVLETDPGARYVGEAAIGTNYNIKHFTKNMLFDEKIGGTCHFALGRSIPASGGKNESVIHWDMLCDLTKGGRYYADGELFYQDGRFIKPIDF